MRVPFGDVKSGQKNNVLLVADAAEAAAGAGLSVPAVSNKAVVDGCGRARPQAPAQSASIGELERANTAP
jgi:hypothetical protein